MTKVGIRIGVALAGLILAIVAIARDDPRFTWLAIGVLAVALALRLLDRRR